jgi:hypothetical protein
VSSFFDIQAVNKGTASFYWVARILQPVQWEGNVQDKQGVTFGQGKRYFLFKRSADWLHAPPSSC